MDCVEYLVEHHGATREEAADIYDYIQIERERLEKKAAKDGLPNGADIYAETMKAIERNEDGKEIDHLAEIRIATINHAKQLELFRFATETYKDAPQEVFGALITGAQRNRTGSRKSVDYTQNSLGQQYQTMVIEGLQYHKAGDLWKVFSSGKFDKQIELALWEYDLPDARKTKLPLTVRQIADVLHMAQEKARCDANLAGAHIRKHRGYIVAQAHDPGKMTDAGFDAWRQTIEPLIDWEHTLAPNQTDSPGVRYEFLRHAYDERTMGKIEREIKEKFDGMTHSKNLANSVSEHRVIEFKSAEAWHEYNQRFGTGNLREAFFAGLASSAQATGLMRVLGTNPQLALENLKNSLVRVSANAGDVETVKRIQAAYKSAIKKQLPEVDGTLNAVCLHPTLAHVGRVTRALQNVTKLGGATLSGITDVGGIASELAYQGHGFLSAFGEAVKLIFTARTSAEKRRIALNLGVFSDILIGDCSARFTFDEGVGGALNKIQNFFFKANLLDQWTNATRTAFALMMSHDIALDRGKAWGKLSKERRRIFDMYNIGEAEWDAMRMGEMSAADGRNYFTAGAVDSLPDNVLAEYLTRTGKEVNEYNIAAARIDIGDKVRTMFKDRTDFAVLNPDARTRSWLRHGTSAGTVEGELLRFIMQFKSFSAAYVQKGLGRFVYGMEGDSRAEVLSQFSKYILLTTALGYVAMSAKDLAKGRVPRDPKEPATWQEAFLQGGGAGIFGDFIFGDFNRYGGGLIATLAGPTMADLEELAKMKSLIQEGDSVEQTLTRFVQSHTPGTSIFYLRAALDYFIMWNLYETMKPGYFSRMKQRIKRQNNQDLWLTPAGY